ncbi:AraC family transcriptional regulator [Paenibacillus sp. FSL H8-0537]|uniref:helix-turn-helix transcriptional regulator n=1 Tax=Paenibacillus sp. FSL H8-0537 TaxID=2921399 RepID=UPI0031014FBE
MESASGERWYEIANTVNQSCVLADHLNQLYRSSSLEQRVNMPEELGRGYWQLSQIQSSMELVLCDAFFNRETSLQSLERDNSLKLSFCLGQSLQWNAEGLRKEYHLEHGEVSAFGLLPTNSSCQFNVNQHIRGLTLKLDRLTEIGALQQLPLHKISSILTEKREPFHHSSMSLGMKRIAQDIFHCHYQGGVKQLYLSGKVLELLAVYFNEAILQKHSEPRVPGLSRTDIDSLHRAKQIVDAQLVTPPSLEALSKLVCLNEFKLKKGFKLLFGLPVHAYIIDRRLDDAYRLLEEGKFNITAAAAAVGFSKASHFSEQFKRKYGINPSEYFKSSSLKGFRR